MASPPVGPPERPLRMGEGDSHVLSDVTRSIADREPNLARCPGRTALGEKGYGTPDYVRCDGHWTAILTTVAVTGELDCDTAPRLNQVLAALADPGRVILVDLCQTEFMDCAGISPMVRRLQTPAHLGGDLVLDSPGGAVSKVIERTQLDRLIPWSGRRPPGRLKALAITGRRCPERAWPGSGARTGPVALYHCGRCEVYG